jgi:hypothetical protein
MSMFAALLLAAAAPAEGVSAMSWLNGPWVERKADGAWTEEYWTPPRGGLMIGAGLAGKGDQLRHWEHMRIITGKDGKIAFQAMPGGEPAVGFPLVRQTETEVVFENPHHDYPQRVTYRREGKGIVATISMIDGSREGRWEYQRPAAPPTRPPPQAR